MSTVTEPVANPASTLPLLIPLKGTLGNVGIPGAPVMHFSLLCNPVTHTAAGTVEITQAIAPPNGLIVIQNVSGSFRELATGLLTYVVQLTGEYFYTLPPPAFGTIRYPFSAHMVIENLKPKFTGRGGFTYNGHNIENVPVQIA
jgi:uncharacterized protein DUF1842